jgi:hypothetical protein
MTDPNRPVYHGQMEPRWSDDAPVFPVVGTGRRMFSENQYINYALQNNWYCDPGLADIWDSDERDLLAFRMQQALNEGWHSIARNDPMHIMQHRMHRKIRHYYQDPISRDLIGRSITDLYDPVYFTREAVGRFRLLCYS